ncbi:MAG: PAS domain-containing sensor histidine kinase [Nitrospinae bacterium]|nr:PAS domain-containing sensor histidine kinase [Nitrospinota bacterium]
MNKIYKEYFEGAIPAIFIAPYAEEIGECKIEYVNPSLIRLFGRDIKGECIIEPEYWINQEMRGIYLDMLKDKGEVDGMDAELRRGDGSAFWCRLYSRYISIEDKLWLQGTLFDITKEKVAEKMRSLFESGIEHDWKNYITGIRLYSNLLERGENLNREQREFIKGIINGVDDLSRGMEEKLEFSKAYYGSVSLNKRAYNLYDLIFETALKFFNIAEREGKKITIDGINLNIFEHKNKKAIANFDYYFFNKIMNNLINNGLKYANEIDITVLQGEDYYTIAVRDNGEGMDSEDGAGIFTLGYRAKNRKSGSTGIGLPYSKLIVDAHGGKIWVESEIGKGSKFYITLPTN